MRRWRQRGDILLISPITSVEESRRSSVSSIIGDLALIIAAASAILYVYGSMMKVRIFGRLGISFGAYSGEHFHRTNHIRRGLFAMKLAPIVCGVLFVDYCAVRGPYFILELSLDWAVPRITSKMKLIVREITFDDSNRDVNRYKGLLNKLRAPLKSVPCISSMKLITSPPAPHPKQWKTASSSLTVKTAFSLNGRGTALCIRGR